MNRSYPIEIAESSPRCSGGSGCSGSSLTVLSHDGLRGAMFLEYGHRGAPCCPHAATTWPPIAVATDAINHQRGGRSRRVPRRHLRGTAQDQLENDQIDR